MADKTDKQPALLDASASPETGITLVLQGFDGVQDDRHGGANLLDTKKKADAMDTLRKRSNDVNRPCRRVRLQHYPVIQ